MEVGRSSVLGSRLVFRPFFGLVPAGGTPSAGTGLRLGCPAITGQRRGPCVAPYLTGGTASSPRRLGELAGGRFGWHCSATRINLRGFGPSRGLAFPRYDGYRPRQAFHSHHQKHNQNTPKIHTKHTLHFNQYALVPPVYIISSLDNISHS